MGARSSQSGRFAGQSAKGRAAVTAAVPAAADTGIDILRKGGNAFDAAVAAALVENVWLPMKCGLAGDVVALLQREGGPVEAALSIGRGPLALRRGCRLEPTGPASIGGAGAPEGYALLAAMGRLALTDLVAPARRMAEEGVAWTAVAVGLTREAEGLLRKWNRHLPFLPDDRVPQVGERLRLPGLAGLLDAFASLGPTLFHGEIGEEVTGRVRAAGGFLTHEDFVRAVACRMPPLVTELPDGARLYATPHPTHGTVLSEALRLLVQGSSETEAVAMARAAFGAGAAGGTSVVTAADDEGNRVVIVHSNSFPQYGAGVVVEAYDLVLNNRPGRGFAIDADEGHWNAPDPLAVPATTLNAWHMKTAEADFWGGTPGGENQAPWNCQVIAALLEGCGLSAAIERPKWGLAKSGNVVCEEDHPLRSSIGGDTAPPLGLRSALQVLRIGPDSSITAAADPRTQAAARALDGRE